MNRRRSIPASTGQPLRGIRVTRPIAVYPREYGAAGILCLVYPREYGAALE